MVVEPLTQIDPGVDLQTAVAALLKVAENVEIVRWIEFPNSLLLFLLVPGDAESGSIYVLDRKQGTWYAVDCEDEQFGGYSVTQLEMLLKECIPRSHGTARALALRFAVGGLASPEAAV
jgi:hypothetical protein